MTRLLLMRHGVTIYNVQKRIQGKIQSRLMKRGFKQAKDLAARLKDERMQALYSSKLFRAIATAREIAKFHPQLKLETLAELNERDFGEYEGWNYYSARKREPRLLAIENNVDYNYMPKGGESWRHVQKRAMYAIRKIIAKHPHETAGVVAHGGTNRVILASIMGLPLKKLVIFRQNNACVNIIDVSGRRVRIICLNDSGHTISEY